MSFNSFFKRSSGRVQVLKNGGVALERPRLALFRWPQGLRCTVLEADCPKRAMCDVYGF